jgi:DNA repair protein RadC
MYIFTSSKLHTMSIKTQKTNSLKLFELKKIQTDFPNKKITSSRDASDFIRQFYGDDIEIFESAFILLLNRANTTIGYAKISQGGIASTIIDVRIVAKYAVETLSTAVIVCHNHPSGNLQPSDADFNFTKKLKNALQILDISLLDSLIISKEGYYSIADNHAI